MIRRTKQRQAVLRTVKLSPDALTAETVVERLKSASLNANPATVYRNLEFLAQRGEVYRIDGEDGVKRYIGHGFHEATFRCQRCGKIRHLKSSSLPQYVDRKMFGDQEVFVSRLVAQGLCAGCQKVLRRRKS